MNYIEKVEKIYELITYEYESLFYTLTKYLDERKDEPCFKKRT